MRTEKAQFTFCQNNLQLSIQYDTKSNTAYPISHEDMIAAQEWLSLKLSKLWHPCNEEDNKMNANDVIKRVLSLIDERPLTSNSREDAIHLLKELQDSDRDALDGINLKDGVCISTARLT